MVSLQTVQTLALGAFRVLMDLAELRGLLDGETGFGGRLVNPRSSVKSRQITRARRRATITRALCVFFASGAVFAIDASEVVMAAIDNERGKVQGMTQQGGTAFADLAVPAGSCRLNRAGWGRGPYRRRTASGVAKSLMGSDSAWIVATSGAVMPREYRGESSFLCTFVQLLIDVGDLLPHGVQVVEDRAELRLR